MGCGDVRLLKTIGSVDFTGQERAALNKLTMPFHRKLKGDFTGSKWSHLPRGLRRLFGGELAARVRNVRVIRKDFNSVQARIMRWIDAFESATDESREQSIVFYREPDGGRAMFDCNRWARSRCGRQSLWASSAALADVRRQIQFINKLFEVAA